jgi:hypothetical protein
MILLIILLTIIFFSMWDEAIDRWLDVESEREPFCVNRGPWWVETFYFIYRIKIKIEDLRYVPEKLSMGFKWFGRTYNTYDWDYSYMLKMLEQKLADMVPHVEDSYLMNSGRYATTLKYTLHHLRMTMLYGDEQTSPTVKLFEKKYGEHWYKAKDKDYAFKLYIKCCMKDYWTSKQHYKKFLRGMQHVEMWRD